MEAGNQQQVAMVLREFKTEQGSPNFPALYDIPTSCRINDLAKQDFTRINMLIIGALTVAFEGMNLKRGMNELQILSLSEMIIETSNEDNLAMEDLMLFLQRMLMGKYKTSYESIDILKFMELFEIYRQERWSTWRDYKWSEHLQHKGIGDANRTCKPDHLSQHFSNLGNTVHELKDALRLKNKEEITSKQADKFYGKT